jgi:predicted ATPase
MLALNRPDRRDWMALIAQIAFGATSLARLHCYQGRRTEARDLLAPGYGWFTESFGTPDLNEAKALLDEFGGV